MTSRKQAEKRGGEMSKVTTSWRSPMAPPVQYTTLLINTPVSTSRWWGLDMPFIPCITISQRPVFTCHLHLSSRFAYSWICLLFSLSLQRKRNNSSAVTGLKAYALNLMIVTSKSLLLSHIYRSLSRHCFGPLSNGATNICNSHWAFGCFLWITLNMCEISAVK
jgi:hypothetical protein